MNNHAFQAARTQLEQLIHNNVDGKEKLAMLSLVKDMAAAMEAEQDIADAALRIGYAKRRMFPLPSIFRQREVRAA